MPLWFHSFRVTHTGKKRYPGSMNTVLSILALAVVALLLGAFFLWRKGGPIKQVLLMVVLAIVAAVNIAIWTLPDGEGKAPLDRLDQIEGPVAGS